jgi:hypothetical protein
VDPSLHAQLILSAYQASSSLCLRRRTSPVAAPHRQNLSPTIVQMMQSPHYMHLGKTHICSQSTSHRGWSATVMSAPKNVTTPCGIASGAYIIFGKQDDKVVLTGTRSWMRSSDSSASYGTRSTFNSAFPHLCDNCCPIDFVGRCGPVSIFCEEQCEGG